MAIIEVGQRRYLFLKQQQYLFSYHVVFEGKRGYMVTEQDGLRTILAGQKQGNRAFHVLDDRTVAGNDAIVGDVVSYEESILVTPGAESGILSSQMLLKTPDGYIISSSEGVVQIGPRCYDSLLAVETKDLLNQKARAQITSRFETTNEKYKWLTEGLCTGYGMVTIEGGKFISTTFDIYMLE
jgi:hypothetical protein